jgi:uncharacterized glyoxalase superfamily protein PhnB
MSIELSDLKRITVVVEDADAAARYLHEVLGAESVSRPGSPIESDDRISLRTVGLGDALLEFVSPLADGPWADQLAEHGPSVLSLAYEVEDVAAAISELATAGVATRPDTGPRTVLATTSLVGFDIELSPLGTDAEPAGRKTWGRVSPLMQIEITHDDIDSAIEHLGVWFGSQRVELEFSQFLVKVTAGRMDIKHVNLGDAMVQFIEPRDDAGPWWDQLQGRGPSVHNLTWFVDDMDAVTRASAAAGTSDLRYFEFDYSAMFGRENMTKDKPIGRIIDARARVGFHIELSEPPALNVNEYLFKKS